MNVATLAMAFAVLQEGSIRGAARLIGRPSSTIGDAFERFESDLAMTLGARSDGGFSLTVAGQALTRSADSLRASLSALAQIAKIPPGQSLRWAARCNLPLAGLANFMMILRMGSIRKASRVLGVAQPHLSRQIARLERGLGCALLLRASAGCEATQAGERLSDVAAMLVKHMDAWTRSARKRFARTERTIKFGTIIPLGHESRLASHLAALVAGWRRNWPEQDLLVSSTTAEDLIAGLRSGRFDIALLDMALQDKRFESRQLLSSELVVVGRREAASKGEALADLLGQRQMVVPSLHSGLRQRIREVIDPLLTEAGEMSHKLVEVDALSIIVNLIVEHDFISILPFDAVQSLQDMLRADPLPCKPQLGFHLTWPRRAATRALAARIESFLAA